LRVIVEAKHFCGGRVFRCFINDNGCATFLMVDESNAPAVIVRVKLDAGVALSRTCHVNGIGFDSGRKFKGYHNIISA
jgi:hypothetical protein